MKVGFITQFFPPEPVLVPAWIAKALRDRGADVRVLTGAPNFPTGDVIAPYSAHSFGKDPHNPSTVRTPLYPSHDQRAIARIANYASWAFTASFGALTHLRDRDVHLVYSSPATAALPALVARLAFRTPLVLLIQDVWPDSITATGLVRRGAALTVMEKLITAFVNHSYRRAAAIAVTSPGMKPLLISRGVPSEKITVITNWADEDLFSPCAPDGNLRRDLRIPDGAHTLLYAGNLGAAQDLSATIQAISEVTSDVHLVIAGDGVEMSKLQVLAEEIAPQRVHFLGRVESDRIPGMIAATDTSLITLRPDALFSITLPSKVQTLLASGASVLCRADGDAAEVVRSAGGTAVSPMQHDELVAAIDELAQLPPAQHRIRRESALSYYAEHLSEERNATLLMNVLIEAKKGRP